MSTDPWTGTRCPVCPRHWPVESIRQQCLTEHGPEPRDQPQEPT